MHILLVDDNPLMQQVLDRFLSGLGYQVMIASRADEAIDCARQRPPDLVLMDLHLPDQDGPQALGAIRALPGCGAAPAIGMSGMDERDAQQLLTSDFDGYLPKPVDLEVLEATVRRYAPATGSSNI